MSKSSVPPVPESSPVSHPSLVPSLHPRNYRSCSSPRLSTAITFAGPGKTLQAFKAECDINTIMKRYQQTGVIDHVNRAQPQFGDIGVYDFQESLNIVLEAEARFAALPAEVRDRFGNNPARLLDWVAQPENAPEATKLGLLEPPPGPVGGPLTPPTNAATAPTTPPSGIPAPVSPPIAS